MEVPSHGSARRRRVCDGRLALGLGQECFSAAAQATEQPHSGSPLLSPYGEGLENVP